MPLFEAHPYGEFQPSPFHPFPSRSLDSNGVHPVYDMLRPFMLGHSSHASRAFRLRVNHVATPTTPNPVIFYLPLQVAEREPHYDPSAAEEVQLPETGQSLHGPFETAPWHL